MSKAIILNWPIFSLHSAVLADSSSVDSSSANIVRYAEGDRSSIVDQYVGVADDYESSTPPRHNINHNNAMSTKPYDNGGGDDNGGITGADLIVFTVLELLDVIGFFGNVLLLIVIVKAGLLERPSFVLITSLAVSDVLHCVVTSVYFYPPIGLRHVDYSLSAKRAMNAVDWTAWGITLTHMSAICIDRLLAIVLLQTYGTVTTVRRMLLFTGVCWLSFITVNVTLAMFQVCCLIVPQPEYYTFGFETLLNSNETTIEQPTDYSTVINMYKPIYVPLEIGTLFTLAVCNPVTLFRLYQRYRRNAMLKRPSFVLMDQVTRTLTRRRLSTMEPSFLSRDAKIFIQIITVTVIFFLYMFIYYLFFYVMEVTEKWSAMLNSFLYTVCHMANPLVYFSLNEQMQEQLMGIVRTCAFYVAPKKVSAASNGVRMAEADPLLVRPAKFSANNASCLLTRANDYNTSIDTPTTPVLAESAKSTGGSSFSLKASSSL